MTSLVTTDLDGFTPIDVSSRCAAPFVYRDHIAAIDFGTTFCSLAYTTRGDSEINALSLNNVYKRVPIAILLNKGVDKCRVVDFGYRAQDVYTRLRPNDRVNYIYFEMIFENHEVSRPTISRLSLLMVFD